MGPAALVTPLGPGTHNKRPYVRAHAQGSVGFGQRYASHGAV